MFPSRRGTPLYLGNLVMHKIKPTLTQVGIEWREWHAFRRGLATNLYSLKVQPRIIQSVLRHGNLSVTMACYVKTVPSDVIEAMNRLEEMCTNMHPFPSEAEKLVV